MRSSEGGPYEKLLAERRKDKEAFDAKREARAEKLRARLNKIRTAGKAERAAAKKEKDERHARIFKRK